MSAAVDMQHFEPAYDVFVGHTPEAVDKIADALVEVGTGLGSLAASEAEDFVVEVWLADVHVVAGQQYVAAVVEVELVQVDVVEEVQTELK